MNSPGGAAWDGVVSILRAPVNVAATADAPGGTGDTGTAARRWCTGVLVARGWVLTAAHCVHAPLYDSNDPTLLTLRVRVGLRHDVPLSASPDGYTEYPVIDCAKHPAFKGTNFPGSGCYRGLFSESNLEDAELDVALIALGTPTPGGAVGTLVPSTLARPLPLLLYPPATTPSLLSASVGLIGYGFISTGTAETDVRQFGTNTITSLTWTAPESPTVINDMYTVGSAAGIGVATYTRNGDSGGPLLFSTTDPALDSRVTPGRPGIVLGVLHGGVTQSSTGEPINSAYVRLSLPQVAWWIDAFLQEPSSAAVRANAPTSRPVAGTWVGEQGGDNCRNVHNPEQDDFDGDGIGDACDLCSRTSAGDAVDPRFRGPNQPNCNVRVEGQLSVQATADQCDPYPCNPIDEYNNPFERPLCTPGTICRVGSRRIYVGMAPRVGVAEAAVPPPFQVPSDILSNATTGFLAASPVWACVCVDLSGALVDTSTCYSSGPCAAVYNPLDRGPRFGWHIATMERQAGTTLLSSSEVFGEPGQTARELNYRTRPSRAVAASVWRSFVADQSWYWDWEAHPNLPLNLPRTMDLAPTEATPANVLFWSRAQYKQDPGRSATSTGPQTEDQRAQRMADFYSDVGTPLVNEHDRIEPLQDFIPGPFFEDRRFLPLRFPMINPCPNPLPSLVSRFQTLAYPLSTQGGPSTHFFANGSTGSDLRGLVIAQLDVRQAQVVRAVATQGAPGDLPTAQNFATVQTYPDSNGWGDIVAFGGRDGGTLTNQLYYTTHSYGTGGSVAFVWHKASQSGSPPSPREGAALSYNAAGTRLYVVGGRNDTTALADVRYYDFAQQKWFLLTPSVAPSARYDAGLAVINDTLFVGGGAAWGGGALGDLYEINGLTGASQAYGNVLPAGAAPWLSFDGHGHGLVYAGGYIGSTWYRDLWLVTLMETTASSSFVYNFAADGVAGTADYSVVADIYHDMYWAIPGHNPGGPTQTIRYLRDAKSEVVPSGGGGAGAARVASGTTSPARMTRRTDTRVRSTVISSRTARRGASSDPQ